MNEQKPKRDYSYLKKYQYSKDNPPPGKKLGSKNKKTVLSREILIELLTKALLIDPETGKKRSTKWLMVELAKGYRRSDKLLLRAVEQIIGKIPDEVHQQVTFVLDGSAPTKALDDSTITDAVFSLPELPNGNDDDNDSNNE